MPSRQAACCVGKQFGCFKNGQNQCDLFLDKYYMNVTKRLGLVFPAEVSRCCLDKVQKTWCIMTNDERSFQMNDFCGLCLEK